MDGRMALPPLFPPLPPHCSSSVLYPSSSSPRPLAPLVASALRFFPTAASWLTTAGLPSVSIPSGDILATPVALLTTAATSAAATAAAAAAESLVAIHSWLELVVKLDIVLFQPDPPLPSPPEPDPEFESPPLALPPESLFKLLSLLLGSDPPPSSPWVPDGEAFLELWGILLECFKWLELLPLLFLPLLLPPDASLLLGAVMADGLAAGFLSPLALLPSAFFFLVSPPSPLSLLDGDEVLSKLKLRPKLTMEWSPPELMILEPMAEFCMKDSPEKALLLSEVTFPFILALVSRVPLVALERARFL
mmetsp:Transcript_5847/g.8625  ORF Transcript_5847/g.8625 Transcript_5847/m.8625 type:complete len:306 (-) Transcript_5847:138-1055(-)